MAYGPGGYSGGVVGSPGRDPGMGAFGPGGMLPGPSFPGNGWSRADIAKMGGTIAGELDVGRYGLSLEDAAMIADTMANRADRNARGIGGTFPGGRDPRAVAASSQYNSNMKSLSNAYTSNKAVEKALATDEGYRNATPSVRALADTVRNAINNVFTTGTQRGIARGAPFYENREKSQKQVAQGRRNGEFTVGPHTFTSDVRTGFTPNTPHNPNHPEVPGTTFDGRSLGAFGLGGWQDPGVVAAARAQGFRDDTDVLANEQLGVPDVPGPLSGLGTYGPDVTAADRGQYAPDFSMGAAYDNLAPNPVDYSGITKGITHGGTPYGFTDAVTMSMEPSMAVYDGGPYGYGQQPDYSSITEGIMHDAYPSNPYGPEALGAPQGFGNYGNAPIGYSPDAFSASPMQTQPATPDVFSGQPMGAPQGFGNYGTGEVGYPSGGFASRPSTATDMSLAGLSPVGQGVVGVGYNPSVVAAAEPIGAPSTRGMSFDQMTRGIVGYEDKPTTTTTQVPNPAYEAWQEAYNNPKATTQEMYAGALTDKLGVDRGIFATPDQVAAARGPAPSKTIGQTTTTTQRSPVYGDVPVGQPISANLSGSVDYGMYPGGNWGGYAKGQGMLAGLDPNIGISGVTGTIGGGFGDPVGYSGGGFSDAYSGGYGGYAGGYGGIGAATSGNEQQGGAWGGYGGNGFSGSQGSDPSGRGGLY